MRPRCLPREPPGGGNGTSIRVKQDVFDFFLGLHLGTKGLARSMDSIWPRWLRALRIVSLREGWWKRVRVLAAIGCGAFACPRRLFCLADWCAEFPIPLPYDRSRDFLSHGPAREWVSLGRTEGRPVSWLSDPSRRVSTVESGGRAELHGIQAMFINVEICNLLKVSDSILSVGFSQSGSYHSAGSSHPPRK